VSAPSGWRRLTAEVVQQHGHRLGCADPGTPGTRCCQPAQWEERLPGGVYVYWCSEHARGRRPASKADLVEAMQAARVELGKAWQDWDQDRDHKAGKRIANACEILVEALKAAGYPQVPTEVCPRAPDGGPHEALPGKAECLRCGAACEPSEGG